MTQAFNLSQLANFVNTSGQLSLTTGVTGILPIANGGTGTATPDLIAGTNITITGSWPNQTINASGGTVTGLLLNIRYFTSGTSTYTPTSGTTFVIVEVVGGGGGGGGTITTSGTRGGGGGGGGYAYKKITSAFSGVTVTVGAGGTVGDGNNGGNGGTSSFGALVSATGGAGGVSRLSTTFALGGLGGSGSSGDINVSGEAAQISWNPAGTANGGSSFYGAGGIGRISFSAGASGLGYGGGGSGAVGSTGTSYAGGAGASGIVIVYEYA